MYQVDIGCSERTGYSHLPFPEKIRHLRARFLGIIMRRYYIPS